jgi:DsbC/DsbD-like thiol-disulfide interchange protein
MKRRSLLLGALALSGTANASRANPPAFDISLVNGGKQGSVQLAGLLVRLAPHWKTYWRMPGDAGIPPQFDWTGSENAGGIEVQYPAPSRFADASGETIGYQNEVLFPILVSPLDLARPLALRLSLLIGVCKDICIPARKEASTGFSDARDLRVRIWQQRVPAKVDDAIRSAIVETGEQAAPVLVLALHEQPLDIFVEHGSGAYFGKPAPGSGGEWRLPIRNAGNGASLRGSQALVTVVHADKAVEQTIVLA